MHGTNRIALETFEASMPMAEYTFITLKVSWDTFVTMKLWRRKVVSSVPDWGTIVG